MIVYYQLCRPPRHLGIMPHHPISHPTSKDSAKIHSPFPSSSETCLPSHHISPTPIWTDGRQFGVHHKWNSIRNAFWTLYRNSTSTTSYSDYKLKQKTLEAWMVPNLFTREPCSLSRALMPHGSDILSNGVAGSKIKRLTSRLLASARTRFCTPTMIPITHHSFSLYLPIFPLALHHHSPH